MASLSVDHVVASESDGFVDMLIRLHDGGAQTVTVNYSTSNNTAGNVNDYTAV